MPKKSREKRQEKKKITKEKNVRPLFVVTYRELNKIREQDICHNDYPFSLMLHAKIIINKPFLFQPMNFASCSHTQILVIALKPRLLIFYFCFFFFFSFLLSPSSYL